MLARWLFFDHHQGDHWSARARGARPAGARAKISKPYCSVSWWRQLNVIFFPAPHQPHPRTEHILLELRAVGVGPAEGSCNNFELWTAYEQCCMVCEVIIFRGGSSSSETAYVARFGTWCFWVFTLRGRWTCRDHPHCWSWIIWPILAKTLKIREKIRRKKKWNTASQAAERFVLFAQVRQLRPVKTSCAFVFYSVFKFIVYYYLSEPDFNVFTSPTSAVQLHWSLEVWNRCVQTIEMNQTVNVTRGERYRHLINQTRNSKQYFEAYSCLPISVSCN